ncbi:isocitrate lyase/PEP mutase family protein [Parahaliea maris]|uniref:Isocitrate lyase/PEP mutase family protein n=1 Tax=Parahaliea maris TaxID=2716870 RepID=A0A5C8ZVW3_9GAMM|nr:isocitrate lyase/PEP mutase family protein [Parahaliea maris]TXS91999.1 isocitrate lyase/PEP mutase family protein [Parahaliea maris]
MANPIVKDKLAAGDFIFAPGIQDMITAVVADRVGFEVVYASGYWLTASAYGLPDAGIVSYTQMVDRVATLVRTSKAAVIADADTGYGGLLNVHHTVKGYEEAGVSGIQLEDQEFPKKCGHTPYKRVVSCEEMVEKIRVAVEARVDPNLQIIARTDALQSEGLSAAIDRANAYRAAGADVLFVEALHSDEEMRTACAEVDGPMMANMSNGGLTPMRSVEEMQTLGYNMAIFPALTSLASAWAVEKALREALGQGGTPEPEGVPLFDFKEFCSLIGFEEVWDFEKKWARD